MPSVLNDELTKAVQQVVKQHLNAFQPRPRKGRRIRAKPSSTPAPPQSTEDIRGVVYSTIAAASGTISGPILPGTGMVKLFDAPVAFPGNPIPPAGSPWVIQTTPTLVENWMFATIAVNKPVLLRPGRTMEDGSTIYCVVAEGCQAVKAS